MSVFDRHEEQGFALHSARRTEEVSRRVSRRRYIWDPEHDNGDGTKGAMVEVAPDYQRHAFGEKRTSEAEIYRDARTVDGVDISSRKKRREYKAAMGVTDASDYSADYIKKAGREREQFYTTGFPERAKREIAEAWERVRSKR
jgi:hypothetical protein